jgi:catechol 2,3-dioxygenase-like lactoylglutathione lyase family enzyme
MLLQIHPKLPMRQKDKTKAYYLNQLGFVELSDYGNYLILKKDNIEIHFFEFKTLDPNENYGQVYIRTNDIEGFYKSLLEKKTSIHPNGHLEIKPWGQKEFSLLDPDNNLLTFGQSINNTH